MSHDNHSTRYDRIFSFFSFFKNRSVGRDTAVGTTAVAAIIATCLSIVFYIYQSQHLFDASQKQIDILTKELNTMLVIPLKDSRTTRIEEICSIFGLHRLIDEIRIEDSRGRTLYSLVKSADVTNRFERQSNIMSAGNLVGRTHLIFSMRPYMKERSLLLKSNLLITGSILLTMLITTWVLLRFFLRNPLQTLERGMIDVVKGTFAANISLPQKEFAPIAAWLGRINGNIELRETELNHVNELLKNEIQTNIVTKEALRASKERYDLAVQGSNDGFWDWDLRSGDIYFSPRWKSMLGYTDDELQNNVTEWLSRVAPEDKEWVQKKIKDYQNGLVDEFQFEYRLQHRNGSYRWMHTRGLCLWDESGNAYRMAGANTDITDRKTFEDYVWEAKNTLDNVLNAMPSKIVGVSKAGRITLWNSTAVRDTGKSRNEVISHFFCNILPDFSFLQHDVRRAIAEEQTITLKRLSSAGPHGSRYYDVIIYPVVMHGAYHAIVRIDDITERVGMEEIMVQTEKMLSVGGLAAGMAHEINNPLGGILQGAQNILRRLDPNLPPNITACEQIGCDIKIIRTYMEQRGIIRFLEGIRESGARAASIVSNMLEFSRRSDTARVPVSIPSLVGRTLELAANDYDLKKQYDFRHIEIIQQYPQDLPKLVCSATELQQVLLNLFKNAAQAMALRGAGRVDPPTITIRAEAERGEMRIDVIDNGPGMREDIRRRIFEPFFTTKAAGEGTGLGLPVSYFIVTSNHGGNLSVNSEPGHGSTFTITLPLNPDEPR